MKLSIRTALFMSVAILALFICPSSPKGESLRSVDIEGFVHAFPCERNAKKPCIDLFIYPKVHIEVHRFGGDKVATVDLPENAQYPSQPTFSLKLSPDKYLFYIENLLNGQIATFGPVTIEEDAKKMRLDFRMYNSHHSVDADKDELEICFKKNIVEFVNPSIGPSTSLEVMCYLATHEKP